MKKWLSFVAVGCAIQYALGGVAGCSSADPTKKTTPVSSKNGTLTMSLETVSESGKVYRLRNATFFVSPGFFFPFPFEGMGSGTAGVTGGAVSAFPDAGVGGFAASTGSGGSTGFFDGGVPAAGSFGAGGKFETGGFFGAGGSVVIGFGGTTGFPGSSTIELSSVENPDEPVIEHFLAPGQYEIDLEDGWFIEQVDNALGTSAPVPATLDSPSFQSFDIQSDQETFVKYDFLVDGSRVSFGSPGRLIVGIGIHETNGTGQCGDGIVEAGEACDGADLGGQTCASATMDARPLGPLFCTMGCQIDTTFCQGSFVEAGTGGFGMAGFGGTAGSVGLPTVDAGMEPAAGGAGGKTSIP